MRRIEYLIYFFLFLLPWQARLILRPGILNGGNWEYGIVGIYGTEVLLWLIIFLLVLMAGRHSRENTLSNFPAGNPPAGGALPAYRQAGRSASLVSLRSTPCPLGLREGFLSEYLPAIFCLSFIAVFVFLAADRLIAIQQFIHVFEAIAIFILLTKSPINRFKAAYAFLAGLALQAGLGIYQFLSQSTFVSKWLGLTLHDAAAGGAAVLENSAGRWLRAYGGLPHPNVLGGYLAVGLLLILFLSCGQSVGKKTRIFLLSTSCLLTAALFFSFSRSAWLGLAIGLLVFWFAKHRPRAVFNFQFLIFSSIILFFAINALIFFPLARGRLVGEGRLENRAVTERAIGYGEARQLFSRHPWFGVGLGNYTLATHDEIDPSRPAWDYQPTHNVFLLMLAELGIAGALVILLFGHFIKPRFSRNFLPIFALFFLLAVFDHYLWSLYSGLMLFSVGAGLLLTTFRPCIKIKSLN